MMQKCPPARVLTSEVSRLSLDDQETPPSRDGAMDERHSPVP